MLASKKVQKKDLTCSLTLTGISLNIEIRKHSFEK